MGQLEGDLVSVIMPSYNAEKLIGRTIESVLDQSYLNWELLVIDDCSKDNTRDVVSKLAQSDSRIKLISLDKNHGAPAAPRNIGVREAKGEWIAFLDADDLWHPKKLEVQLKLMTELNVAFSSSLSRNFKDEKDISNDEVSDNPSYEKITFSKQRFKGRIANSGVVVRKYLMLKYPFNEDFRYKAVEDYHCWLRIHKEIKYSLKLQAVLLNYRIINGQISGSKLYMLKTMFMLHKEFEGSSLPQAFYFTVTHAAGGFINKFIKRGF
jgi:glycosyltransferase involved in cell wall biosynthesis